MKIPVSIFIIIVLCILDVILIKCHELKTLFPSNSKFEYNSIFADSNLSSLFYRLQWSHLLRPGSLQRVSDSQLAVSVRAECVHLKMTIILYVEQFLLELPKETYAQVILMMNIHRRWKFEFLLRILRIEPNIPDDSQSARSCGSCRSSRRQPDMKY